MKQHTTQYPQLFFTIIFLIPLFAFSQPDIPVDAVLKNNSDSWKVKTKQKGISGIKPAEVNFGPIKTIETNAEKAKELSREVSRDLFWKNIKTVKSRESSMVLLYNDIDSIAVNMLTINEETVHKRNTTGTIFNADKHEAPTSASSAWIDEMIIVCSNDTTQWRYTALDSIHLEATGYVGKLQSSTDSFFVRPVDNSFGKKLKDVMFSLPASGLVFFHEGKQVAALQLTLKKTIWISKDLNQSAKQALLATISALFGTIKSENDNGF